MKSFKADYTDFAGNTAPAEYKIYVRRIEKGFKTFVNPAGETMWENGVYYGDRPGVESGLRTASASEFYDVVEEIIASSKAEGMLFKHD